MFDARLIKNINSGRCFVFIGSGPSCEVGYPSWGDLAQRTYENINAIGLVSDHHSYEKYISNKKYPELFRLAERDMGDRIALVDLLKALIEPGNKKQGLIYQIICKWPFACYLTTNYDDEISSHLSDTHEYYSTIRNRQEDFSLFRDNVSHIIQKVHSDLSYPEEVVLTSLDYTKLYVNDEGQYFRDKLRHIFEFFDILIIGHSLSDPDISYVLQLARKTASPSHPIYMIAADFTKADELEYLEKYNIVLIQYSNHDGTHSALRKILKLANKFIVPKGYSRERDTFTVRPAEEIESAISLFLHRSLQQAPAADYLSPIILTQVSLQSGPILGLEKLISLPLLENFVKNKENPGEMIESEINSLVESKLLALTPEGITITKEGTSLLEKYKTIRKTERDQAYGQFTTNLKSIYTELTAEQANNCKRLAEDIIVTSFSNRELSIANKVFSGRSSTPGELSDLFQNISRQATKIENMDLRVAFVEAAHQFLVEPNLPQRNYLASVSQGYFLYHLLGLDPLYSKTRHDIFNKTLWICDSSIILPAIATECHNNEYAIELFRLLLSSSALLYTTKNLFQETWDHFSWAISFMKIHGIGSSELLKAAILKGSYNQNLFIDGYIRLSAEGAVGTFEDYIDKVLEGNPYNRQSFEKIIAKKGIHLIDIQDIDGFTQEDWGEVEDAKTIIQDEREKRGIYKSPLQVASEAEVLILLTHLRSGKYKSIDGKQIDNIYFVSQSKIIDNVSKERDITTWSPEALYRYISSLPGAKTNPDLLQQCLLNEYYYAGVSFIDKSRYTRFFGPSIDAAKTSFVSEKQKYINELEASYTQGIDGAFDKTPDLEKPFFVAQMGWRLAEASKKREEVAKQRAQDAEAKVKRLEAEKGNAWKQRDKSSQEQEAARLRNKQDPKHMRKRRNQSKKRLKKK